MYWYLSLYNLKFSSLLFLPTIKNVNSWMQWCKSILFCVNSKWLSCWVHSQTTGSPWCWSEKMAVVRLPSLMTRSGQPTPEKWPRSCPSPYRLTGKGHQKLENNGKPISEIFQNLIQSYVKCTCIDYLSLLYHFIYKFFCHQCILIVRTFSFQICNKDDLICITTMIILLLFYIMFNSCVFFCKVYQCQTPVWQTGWETGMEAWTDLRSQGQQTSALSRGWHQSIPGQFN